MQGAWVRSLVRSHMLKLTHGAAKQISKINIKKKLCFILKTNCYGGLKAGNLSSRPHQMQVCSFFPLPLPHLLFPL